MRRPFIAGNWKMNLDRASAIALAESVSDGVETSVESSMCEVAVCPPHVYLESVVKALADSTVAVGAQNVYHETKGPFTGEISPEMLTDLGCRYVIVGHSERRQLFGDTDPWVNRKVHAALAAGLIPILCVGETLEQRDAGRTGEIVERQFDGSLADIGAEQMAQIVIAYEPVWAIGTGKVATPDQAEQVHSDLRRLIENRYNTDVSQNVRIQYGGSVKPSNAAELLAQPNIDGALVGGASLNMDDFLGIVRAAIDPVA